MDFRRGTVEAIGGCHWAWGVSDEARGEAYLVVQRDAMFGGTGNNHEHSYLGHGWWTYDPGGVATLGHLFTQLVVPRRERREAQKFLEGTPGYAQLAGVLMNLERFCDGRRRQDPSRVGFDRKFLESLSFLRGA